MAFAAAYGQACPDDLLKGTRAYYVRNGFNSVESSDYYDLYHRDRQSRVTPSAKFQGLINPRQLGRNLTRRAPRRARVALWQETPQAGPSPHCRMMHTIMIYNKHLAPQIDTYYDVIYSYIIIVHNLAHSYPISLRCL
eukprot:scaffold176689_cov39-Prasinocladus_malaysianus.AAC.3